MKKVISITLCMLMMFSFCFEFNSVSYAYSFSDLSLAQEAEIIDVLDMGLMKGDEWGRFNPNSYLTKAEAATIVCRMIGEKNTYLATVSKFSDVPFSHWASQTISVASSKGLVLGNGNKFEPNKKLTCMELITMCLRVLGVGKALDATGAWPRAHINFVNDHEILTGITGADYYVTRIEAARILSQFLSAKTWEVNNATGIYEQTDISVVEKYLGAATYKNVIITDVDTYSRKIDGIYQDSKGEYNKELPYTYLSYNINEKDLVPGVICDITVKGGSIIKLDIKQDNENRYINFDEIVEFNTTSNYIKVRVDEKTHKYNISEDLLIVTTTSDSEVGTKNKMSRANRLVSNEMKEYYGADTYEETDDEWIKDDKIYYTSSSGRYEAEWDPEDEDRINPSEEGWYEKVEASDTGGNEITGTLVLDGNSHVISISLSTYKNIMYVKSVTSTKITGQSGLNIASKNRLDSLSLSKKDVVVKDSDGRTLDVDDIEKGDVILVTDKSADTIYILRLDDTSYGYIEYEKNDPDCVHMDGETFYLNRRYCTNGSFSTTRKTTLWLDQNRRIVAWKRD